MTGLGQTPLHLGSVSTDSLELHHERLPSITEGSRLGGSIVKSRSIVIMLVVVISLCTSILLILNAYSYPPVELMVMSSEIVQEEENEKLYDVSVVRKTIDVKRVPSANSTIPWERPVVRAQSHSEPVDVRPLFSVEKANFDFPHQNPIVEFSAVSDFYYAHILDELGVEMAMKNQILTEIKLTYEESLRNGGMFQFQDIWFIPSEVMARYLDSSQIKRYKSYQFSILKSEQDVFSYLNDRFRRSLVKAELD